MKISVCGKGGSGKSALTSLLANQAEGQGFWFINLFGERKFIERSIQTIDLMDGHFALLRKEKSI